MAGSRILNTIRTFLSPASSVYFYGLIINASTILLIRLFDPVYGPKIELIPYFAFIVYYLAVAIWLSRRMVRTRSLESWFDLVLLSSMPVGVYYGYLSFQAPPYAFVFWIWGSTVGMPGFGFLRGRYWILWVIVMLLCAAPGFITGAFEFRRALSMVWVVIFTFYMLRASGQMKKIRQALSVHLADVRRNKRELEKTHQKLRAASDRFQSELELAERLQQGLLPVLSTLADGLVIRGRYLAMQNLGGDFYDLATVDGKTILLIADVTGHGVAASLITTMTKASFHAHKGRIDPAAILGGINRDLCEFLAGGQHFVTAICAQFDTSSNRVLYANAGHPPAFHLSGPDLALLGDDSLLLGVSSATTWKSNQIVAKPRDRFLFYTDGLTETYSDDHSMYGDRLQEMTVKHGSAEPLDFLAMLFHDLSEFRGTNPQSDDIAAVCVDLPG